MIRLTTACDDNGEMRLLLNTKFANKCPIQVIVYIKVDLILTGNSGKSVFVDKNSIKKHKHAEGATIAMEP